MGRLFGTDGARGIAITELTCERAMLIGRAAALVLTNKTNKKPCIFIGKDTRISSDVLEAALCAGICSVGADAVRLGVVPTPAVAYLVRTKKADAGVMISASHNSVEFNGIKLFSSTGYKLPDSVEEEIEKIVLDSPEDIPLKSNTEIGRIKDYSAAQDDYIDYIASCIDSDLNGIYLAIDCANGSASSTAKKLFEKLGARVDMLSAEPDGTNINDNCGSTHMENLMEYVKEHKCDAGLAFDGDADRCLAVDENGNLVDGDKLIAIAASSMKKDGKLKNNTVVVTVMSNLGFFHFAKREGIETAATKVGDRYVLEEMLANDYNIGGEQSGHIIFLDHAATGDGQLSGAKTIETLVKYGKKMSEAASVMESFPQLMLNVHIKPEHRNVWRDDENVKSVMSCYEKKLGNDGRILVRESGTEPLIRVMAEGKDAALMEDACKDIASAIEEFVQK